MSRWKRLLDGRVRQSLPVGPMNNVDVRAGFPFASGRAPIVVATDRTPGGVRALAIFMLDPTTRRLRDVTAAPGKHDLGDPYGLCLHHDPVDDVYYAFVNDKSGRVEQHRLIPTPAGRVRTERVRAWSLATQPEGCTVDDVRGVLYVGEERRGVWRFPAAPDADPDGRLIAETDGETLVADVEGIDLAIDADGRRVLVVSSQGDDAFAAFDVTNGGAGLLGRFRIADAPVHGVDGASETDGLAVTTTDLGGAFGDGLLVVQDGRNRMPAEHQSFKLVAWRAVLNALADRDANRD